MFNIVYRNAIRNRPGYFRKFGRTAWVKRSGMSRPGKPKASKFTIGSNNNYISSKLSNDGPGYTPERLNYDRSKVHVSGYLRKRTAREFDMKDFGYKTFKVATTLGLGARAVYGYSRWKHNRKYGHTTLYDTGTFTNPVTDLYDMCDFV